MNATKRYLTDRTLKALAPSPKTKRREIWDTVLPGFGVRVGDEIDPARKGKAGRVTFILYTRFPTSPNPTRRVLGRYPTLSLEQARAKAGKWLAMIRRGEDPAVVEARAREDALRRASNEAERTFGAVAEKFIHHIKANNERKADEVERALRKVFAPVWGQRAIGSISPHDVAAVIEGVVKRGKRARAHNLFSIIRRLFRWAIPLYLEHSPCANLSPRRLIGEQVQRDVILTDDGLRVLWRSAIRMPYPFGPLYRLLALSALRLADVSEASWLEFNPELVKLLKDRRPDTGIDWSKVDDAIKIWTIPSARMKKTSGEAKPFVVTLTTAMLESLEAVPFFSGGEFLFSNNFGASPIRSNYFSKPKARLDRRMLRTLRAIERKRGGDPSRASLRDIIETSQERDGWDNHDIRRTVRTHLSALRVAEEVREAVLAHAKGGVRGVYDRYKYLDEKREALELWAARLRSIIEPRPSKVIELAAKRS